MKKLKVNQTVFQSGDVKICVSLCGRNLEECVAECEWLEKGIDVVEWRMDYVNGSSPDDWLEILKAIRSHSASFTLLATWRRREEGGQQPIETKEYVALNQAIIRSGLTDMIDVELFAGEEVVKQLVQEAHAHGVKVVMSHHDIHTTPTSEAMMIRLRAMERMGGDLVKLAVMPQCSQDVWNLLSVSSTYSERADSRPLISMAMGDLGVLSRIGGTISGSVMSFGSLKQASAPGQLPWKVLKDILTQLHPQSQDHGEKINNKTEK